ncbi:MAG: hypothetical protein FWC16_09695 [Defluviitaleaceae bacterium]|nr:hypothetical protein [Defluviitaleaceae bacterium]MCL2275186.1 hypothetical protein [Defluviitaleaceae bacterium]
MPQSVWSSINTLLEAGLEIYRLMSPTAESSKTVGETTVDKLTNGAILVSNDKDVLIAIDKSAAAEKLSEEAIALGHTRGWFLCYHGAASAIPLYELSQKDAHIRKYIISEESLRATLCGNYPEYVKSHNMSNPPEAQIKDADAPPYLFLQKQLDQAADETAALVASAQQTQTNEFDRRQGIFDDVLELER